MEAPVVMTCGNCGRQHAYPFGDRQPDTDAVACLHCGRRFAIVGELRARAAQQAIGIGASEARDDHVPLDGDGDGGDGHGV